MFFAPSSLEAMRAGTCGAETSRDTPATAQRSVARASLVQRMMFPYPCPVQSHVALELPLLWPASANAKPEP